VKTNIHRFLAPALVLTALTLLTPAPVWASENVYQKLLPSAAYVEVKLAVGKSSGSGVLVDVAKRWLLTNYHVVQTQSDVAVLFPTRENGKLMTSKAYYAQNFRKLAVAGKVIALDGARDLAVVELAQLPADIQAVPLASESAQPGQVVHTIGNPGTEPALWLYSYGKVRQVYQKTLSGFLPSGLPMNMNCQVVLTTVPVNPGDSGGPVVNDNGELVALVSGQVPTSNDMTFMVDLSEIQHVLNAAAKTTVAK
jgi:S1-C subfamily serine protease